MAAKRQRYKQAKPRALVWTALTLVYCLLNLPGVLLSQGSTPRALQSSHKQVPPGYKIPALPGCAFWCFWENAMLPQQTGHAAPLYVCSFPLRSSKMTRRFTIATMWDLGTGKHLGEERMLEELHFLTELIKSFKGELEMSPCYFTKPLWKTSGLLQKLPIQLRFSSFLDGPFQLWFLNTAPTNITFAVLFGRFDYEDAMFLTLLRLIDEVTHLPGSLFLHVSYLLCRDAPESHRSW